MSRVQPLLSKLENVLHLASRRLFQQARELFVYEAQLDEALDRVSQGLRLEPGNVQGWVLRADILFCLRQDEAAQQSLHYALRLAPACVEALLSQASVLEALGQIRDALRANRLALRHLRSRHRYLLPSLYEQQINLLVRLKKTPQAIALLHESRARLSPRDHQTLRQEFHNLLRKTRPARVQRLKQARHLVLHVARGEAS